MEQAWTTRIKQTDINKNKPTLTKTETKSRVTNEGTIKTNQPNTCTKQTKN